MPLHCPTEPYVNRLTPAAYDALMAEADALAQRDEEEADWASRLEDAEGWC